MRIGAERFLNLEFSRVEETRAIGQGVAAIGVAPKPLFGRLKIGGVNSVRDNRFGLFDWFQRRNGDPGFGSRFRGYDGQN